MQVASFDWLSEVRHRRNCAECCLKGQRATCVLWRAACTLSAGRCDYCKVQSTGDYVKAVFGDGSFCLRRYGPNWFIRGVPLLKRQLLYRGIQTFHQWNHSNRKLKCCGMWRRVFGQQFPPFRRIVVLPKRMEPLTYHDNLNPQQRRCETQLWWTILYLVTKHVFVFSQFCRLRQCWNGVLCCERQSHCTPFEPLYLTYGR
jgi:hypothetical protein